MDYGSDKPAPRPRRPARPHPARARRGGPRRRRTGAWRAAVAQSATGGRTAGGLRLHATTPPSGPGLATRPATTAIGAARVGASRRPSPTMISMHVADRTPGRRHAAGLLLALLALSPLAGCDCDS